MRTEDTLRRQFDEAHSSLDEYRVTLHRLISQLLAERGIRPHLVTSRLKTKESLLRKVGSAPGRYQALADLTDIVGIRAITYLADDVDRVGRCIRDEFRVHDQHSVDKRLEIAADRFGYISLHYVVEFSTSRADLPEYARFSGMLAEVQIRSILQHAWAEIEHDLGYKTDMSVPREARREFSRLAGLLEVADASFVSLRNQLAVYEQELPERIRIDANSVPIDRASLKVFLRDSPAVATLNTKVLAIAGGRVVRADDDILHRHVAQLAALDLATIGDLERLLREEEDAIVRFMKHWISGPSSVHGDILPIVFLEYLLLARSGDEVIEQFLSSTDYPAPRDLVERLRTTYDAIRC